MAVPLREVARILGMSEGELVEEGVRELLRARLRRLSAEREALLAKVGAKSLEGLDEMLKTGKVREEEVAEIYQRVDWLEEQIEAIGRLLEREG